jgi:hypothetical protein
VVLERTSSVPLPTESRWNAADTFLPVMVPTSFARGVNRGVKPHLSLTHINLLPGIRLGKLKDSGITPSAGLP